MMLGRWCAGFFLSPMALVLWSHNSAAQQADEPTTAIEAGQEAQGTVHRAGQEWFGLSFPRSGKAVVEVSGFPADCAFQVGSRGFQQSETSPIDWTDGQPGQPVKHSFQVQAGRPGKIWVQLRSRLSGVSTADWVGVMCSKDGPCYTLPERGKDAGPAPESFEGRPVRPAITFRLIADLEGATSKSKPDGTAGPAGDTPPIPPMATTPTRPFRDDAAGFGFDYPAGWSAVRGAAGTYRIHGPADSPAAEAEATIKIVAKQDPQDSALKHLLRIHGQLASEFNAVASKLGPTKVAGEAAVFAIHSYAAADGRGQKVPFDHVQVVMEHGPRIYLVSFVAPHDLFVKQIPLFKQMLNSWRY